MGDVAQLVRSEPNKEVIDALESLLAEARRGEFTACMVFRFGQLPRTVGHTIVGNPTETDVIFAIERWKINHLLERE